MKWYERPIPTIPIDASLARIDFHLRTHNIFIYSHQYIKDYEFERYVLNTLTNVGQAIALLLRLDSECKRWGPAWSGGCSKVRAVWPWYMGTETMWNNPQRADWKFWWEHFRSPLAYARRVCCGCHETGSFARAKR